MVVYNTETLTWNTQRKQVNPDAEASECFEDRDGLAVTGRESADVGRGEGSRCPWSEVGWLKR